MSQMIMKKQNKKLAKYPHIMTCLKRPQAKQNQNWLYSTQNDVVQDDQEQDKIENLKY